MSTIVPTHVDLAVTYYGNQVVIYTWTPLAVGDDGQPVQGPGWADRTFQAEGTFGSGGTVVVEGSNDGTNYHTLYDPFGNPISFTGAGLEQVTELPLWVRPRVSAGDGTTAITVTAVFARHGYP